MASEPAVHSVGTVSSSRPKKSTERKAGVSPSGVWKSANRASPESSAAAIAPLVVPKSSPMLRTAPPPPFEPPPMPQAPVRDDARAPGEGAFV